MPAAWTGCKSPANNVRRICARAKKRGAMIRAYQVFGVGMKTRRIAFAIALGSVVSPPSSI